MFFLLRLFVRQKPETVEIDKFGEESIKAMKMSVPVFDGAHEEDMNATLDLAGVPKSDCLLPYYWQDRHLE